jgi:hypothetical protein
MIAKSKISKGYAMEVERPNFAAIKNRLEFLKVLIDYFSFERCF